MEVKDKVEGKKIYKPKTCVYGTCSSKTTVKTGAVNGAPGIFFIKFPSAKTQAEKCLKWVHACGRPDFSISDVKRSTYICSLHFVDFAGPTSENPDPIPLSSLYPYLVCNQSLVKSTPYKPEISQSPEILMVENDSMTHKIEPKLLVQSLSPPLGWSLELQECTAVFSKIKDNYRFLQCSFNINETEIVSELKIMGRPVPIPKGTKETVMLKTRDDILNCLRTLNKYKCCPGNNDKELVCLYKTQQANKNKTKSYYCEKLKAVFSQNCWGYMTSTRKRCVACTMYRSSLRKLRYRTKMKAQNTTAKKLIKKSKQRILQSNKNKKEIESAMTLLKSRSKSAKTGSFEKIFLKEQMKALTRSKYGMRWNPTFLKWCIYMKNKSKTTYEALRKTKFMFLPSTRTLYNHNHTVNNSPGFSTEMFEEMANQCDLQKLPEHQKYFALLIDEVSIKEDLVSDKKTGFLTGFVDINETHNKLNDMENEIKGKTTPPLATHVLQMMIRGITSDIEIPFAHFGTKGIGSAELHSLLWEAIRKLEISGFRILAVVGDGAVANRKFFHLCQENNISVPHMTTNLFAMNEERPLFFISDVPHLLKTARNGFSNSGANSKSRQLWNNGEEISWKVILRLYYLKLRKKGEFKHLPKLTYSHVFLYTHSKMKVNLAAQVMSETVASAIETVLEKGKYTETVKFIRVINKFFDLCNVKNRSEGIKTRNKDKFPYTSVADERLKWLECDLISYLDDWKQQVMNREGDFSKSQRERMLLSRETIEGLKISALSISSIVKFLLNKGADYILTRHLNQDPLEQLFGKHRAAGGRNTNPTLWHYGANKDNFKSIRSVALDAIGGNTQIEKE